MYSAQDVEHNLFSRTTKGIKLGLDRMLKAAASIGNPQDAYPSIHVAGTNGKGSTSAYIESMLREHGFKTGLFTSPHIVAFEERFIINGKPVTSQQWMDVYRTVETLIEDLRLTFFEAVTLIAFELFKREKVEWAVFETGMGGRLDSTNIILPKASSITTIAMDHMNFLGNDLVSIAREKLGIVKKGVPLVMTLPPQKEIMELARAKCKELNVPHFFVSGKDAMDIAEQENKTTFYYKNHLFSTSMPGDYQVENCLVALKTMEVLGFIDLDKAAQGIKKTFLPGRFQITQIQDRIVVFDVGHNPNAAGQLVKTLKSRFNAQPLCIVAGIMKDKDIASILKHYCECASRLVLTRPAIDRAAEAAFLAQNVPPDFKPPVEVIPQVKDAVQSAFKGREDVICITGSFYTVGEAMIALDVRPFAIQD
jgi:folylpolyglutamate synthase/dihydrofolate synthase